MPARGMNDLSRMLVQQLSASLTAAQRSRVAALPPWHTNVINVIHPKWHSGGVLVLRARESNEAAQRLP